MTRDLHEKKNSLLRLFIFILTLKIILMEYSCMRADIEVEMCWQK